MRYLYSCDWKIPGILKNNFFYFFIFFGDRRPTYLANDTMKDSWELRSGIILNEIHEGFDQTVLRAETVHAFCKRTITVPEFRSARILVSLLLHIQNACMQVLDLAILILVMEPQLMLRRFSHGINPHLLVKGSITGRTSIESIISVVAWWSSMCLLS